MKEIIISNCEKNHILKCLETYIRVDGRAFNEFRELNIQFGRDWGCCYVSLGETRVLAQVSCEIQQPKQSRPSEGILNINVELSPMGAPNFEAGRPSELSVHLNRLLEKCIKDSRAVDLESLCIKTNEKVWALRVDINVINHEGNLLDCASIAALAALAHFKRPDVTSDGENFIIHTSDQRDPIPTVVHHYPICVSYATFNKSTISIADPSFLEEGVSEAQLIYAVNAFKEICSLHLGGSAMANANLIIECAKKAAARAFTVVQEIKQSLEKDKEIRTKNEFGLLDSFIISRKENEEISKEELSELINIWNIKEKSKRKKKNIPIKEEMEIDSNEQVISLGEGSAGILNEMDEENDLEESDDDIQIVQTKAIEIEIDNIDDNEEEEETLILKSENTT